MHTGHHCSMHFVCVFKKGFFAPFNTLIIFKSPVPCNIRCSCGYLQKNNGKNAINTPVLVILMVMLRMKVVNKTHHTNTAHS